MEDKLLIFGGHCKKVFEQSLSLSDPFEHGIVKDDELEVSHIILEALDHLIAYSPEHEDNSHTLSFFTKDTASQYSSELKSCGLFPEDNVVPDSTVLLRYIQIRDTQRKLAHQSQIVKRRRLLNKVIQRVQTKYDSQKEDGTQFHPDVTRRKFHVDARTKMKDFVHSFQAKIGTHSFLAGLRRLFESQIGKEKTMSWGFDAFILTEAVIVKDGRSSDNYLEKSLELLFFLLVVEESDVETGQNSKENDDGGSLLNVCIHPDISDYFLSQLLKDIPRLDNLDARPAGILKAGAKIRTNSGGALDEISKLDLWKDSFCYIL